MSAEFKSPVAAADILLPKAADLTKWAVIACDQYTSQPEYWEELKSAIGKSPSALKMILPEVYLHQPDYDARVKSIHRAMKTYLSEDMFNCFHGFIYVRRHINGRIRHGLVAAIDLQQYDYRPGSDSVIRATEETIIERIPARADIRKKAALEIPHTILLTDDKKNIVLAPIKKGFKQLKKLYDFTLNGGDRIEGYLIEDTKPVLNAFAALAEKSKNGILLAVGDGNHSLAAAKAVYDEARAAGRPTDTLRYSLVEIVNLHDSTLNFHSINRVLFQLPQYGLTRVRDIINEDPALSADIKIFSKKEYMDEEYKNNPGLIRMRNQWQYMALGIGGTDNPLRALQLALDCFVAETGVRIDYVHGNDVAYRLGSHPNNLCFVPPPIDKSALFGMISGGPLPRKAFSMGEASGKRYYMESRKL